MPTATYDYCLCVGVGCGVVVVVMRCQYAMHPPSISVSFLSTHRDIYQSIHPIRSSLILTNKQSKHKHGVAEAPP
jgi:hypothetical protein